MTSDLSEANAILQEAMQCHQQGDLYEADLLYAQFLQLEPGNSQALRLRGILARERGEIERSLELLHAAKLAAPDSTAALGEIALTHMAAGELQQAEQILQQALQIDPAANRIHANLGAVLQHRGHVQAAINSYRTVLAADPNDIEVRCNLAKALADANQPEQALQECAQAAELSNNHPYVLATQGAVLTDNHDYAAARAVLEESTQQEPYNDMALVNLALCCYELGDIQTAEQILQQAVTANPWNARAVADLANCFGALGRNEEALELCAGFLQENPGERLIINAYALALHNAGQQEQARELTDCATLVRVYDLHCPTGFASMTAFNEALTEQICNDPSRLANPVSKATTGGSQTGELELTASACLKSLHNEFTTAIHAAAADYIANGLSQHPLMAPATDDWTLRVWGTVLQTGGLQTAHMHPLGWLSGVYYAHVPEDMAATDPQAGWLEFGKPPQRFYSATPTQTQRYEPKAGRLILFPSWFWHQTVPFSSTSDRISIAFDVLPRSMLRML